MFNDSVCCFTVCCFTVRVRVCVYFLIWAFLMWSRNTEAGGTCLGVCGVVVAYVLWTLSRVQASHKHKGGKKLGQRTPALCVFVFVLTAGCSDKRSSSQASRPSIFPFALHFFIQQEKAKGGIQDIYSPRSKQFFIFFLFLRQHIYAPFSYSLNLSLSGTCTVSALLKEVEVRVH